MRHAGTGLRAFAALALCASLGAGVAATAANDPPAEQVPGTRIQVLADGLPPPFATPSASNAPLRVMRPENPPFRLPPGFSVAIFADKLTNPRSLLTLPNGDELVAESKAGAITLLRDADGDGVAEFRATFADGFAKPYGLAFQGGQIYVADTAAVWQIPYGDGDERARGPARPITSRGALGSGGGHWTRNLAFSPDGSRFYVAIGSQSNLGEDPIPRASVQSFAADGQDQRTYASGLRNPVGMAFYPGTADLYVVVNERDGLGDGLVPDFLTRLAPDGFYGWPYAYIGPHPQPGLAAPPGVVEKTLVPDLLFRPHSAAARPRLLRGRPVPGGVSRRRLRRAARFLEQQPADRLHGGAGAVRERPAEGLLRAVSHRLLARRLRARRCVRPAGGACRRRGRQPAGGRRRGEPDLAGELCGARGVPRGDYRPAVLSRSERALNLRRMSDPERGLPRSFVHQVPDGDNRPRQVCADCGFVNYENPKVVVGVVARWQDRILMCRRAINPRRGFWTLPAGYLELNETTADGAQREAREEASRDRARRAARRLFDPAALAGPGDLPRAAGAPRGQGRRREPRGAALRLGRDPLGGHRLSFGPLGARPFSHGRRNGCVRGAQQPAGRAGNY